MKRKHVSRVLMAGFALVILLLAAVAVIGVRRAFAIQANAAALIRNHVGAERLVDELEEEQNRFGSIVLRMALEHSGRALDVTQILEDVDSGNRRVQSLVQSAVRDRAAWNDLGRASTDITAAVHSALREPHVTDTELDDLLDRRQSIVRAVSGIIRADSTRASQLETAIAVQSRDLIGESGWLLGACFLLAVACAILSIRVTGASFRQQELQAAEMRRVSWHMLQGQEAAARRFAHELHDELGQSLTALKTTLRMITAEEFLERRADCTGMLEQAIRDVRELSQLLRPMILDDFGLDAALRWLTERFQQHTGIRVDYASNFTDRLAEESETHLFRITQESLTNVARHSRATDVKVSLSRLGDTVNLTVEDNGRGLPAAAPPASRGLGLIGMRERANHAGGKFRLTEGERCGVRIEVSLPYRQPANESDSQNAHLVSR